jgi:hypothetical protein
MPKEHLDPQILHTFKNELHAFVEQIPQLAGLLIGTAEGNDELVVLMNQSISDEELSTMNAPAEWKGVHVRYQNIGNVQSQ